MNFWNLLGLPSKQDYITLQERLNEQSRQFQEAASQLEALLRSSDKHQSRLLEENLAKLSSQVEMCADNHSEMLEKGLSRQKQDMQVLFSESGQAVLDKLHTVLSKQQEGHSQTIDLLNSADEKREHENSLLLQHLTEQYKDIEGHSAEQLKQIELLKHVLEDVQIRQNENDTLILRCFAEQDGSMNKHMESLRTAQRSLQKTQIETLSEMDSLFKLLKSIWINELSSYLEDLADL